MDFRREANQVAPRATTQEAAAPSANASSVNAGSNRPQNYQKSNKKRWPLLAVAALLLLGTGFGLGAVVPGTESEEQARVDSSKYQAVFLTNDQVYFGKIADISDEAVVIEDIYYLQNGGEQAESTNQGGGDAKQQANLSLAKLGSELHGPQDKMHINKDQVMFWENLKDDGKVAQAIKNYKK